MFVSCPICKETFENELSLKDHQENLHTNSGTSYPCQSCDFDSESVAVLDEHIEERHREHSYSIQVGKRIKQNLKNVNFEEDSDDDDNDEHVPSREENNEFKNDNEEITFLKRPKRKITSVVSPPRKKPKTKDAEKKFTCDICSATFTRNDNLKRHVLNKHK